MSLFDADEPALKQVSHDAWVMGYAAELKKSPPVNSCAGEDAAAEAQRLRLARKDIGRAVAAARRLGCSVQLLPLPDLPKGGRDA